MLCYAMLGYDMICYDMLRYARLCNAMPCHAMPCHAMLCYAMPCYAMLCYAMLRYAMLFWSFRMWGLWIWGLMDSWMLRLLFVDFGMRECVHVGYLELPMLGSSVFELLIFVIFDGVGGSSIAQLIFVASSVDPAK